MTSTRVDERVKELAQHTGLDISLGYIGDLTPQGKDYRLWHVWVMNAKGGNPVHPNNRVSLAGHGVSTDELDSVLLPLVSEGQLYRSLTREGVRPAVVYAWDGEVAVDIPRSLKLIEDYKARYEASITA